MQRRWFGGDAKGSIPAFGLKPGASDAVYTTDRLYIHRHRTNPNEPMSENDKSHAYGQARAAFDALKMDERAAFLVESVVAMLAEGVGEAGRVVSEVIDEMAQHLDTCCDDEPAAAQSKEAADSPSAAKPKSGRAAGTKKAPAKPSARRSAGSAKSKE